MLDGMLAFRRRLHSCSHRRQITHESRTKAQARTNTFVDTGSQEGRQAQVSKAPVADVLGAQTCGDVGVEHFDKAQHPHDVAHGGGIHQIRCQLHCDGARNAAFILGRRSRHILHCTHDSGKARAEATAMMASQR